MTCVGVCRDLGSSTSADGLPSVKTAETVEVLAGPIPKNAATRETCSRQAEAPERDTTLS